MVKKKTIMESLFIDEISAVDRPAQEGARALIIKRDESVEGLAEKQAETRNAENDPALDKSVNGEEQNPMTEKKDVEMVEKSKLDQVSADLARAEAFGALNDMEKNHYYSLDAEGQSAFLKLDTDGRNAEVAKAQDADPVVYKDLDGNEFRKSDDSRAIDAAKRADKALAKAQEAEARAEAQVLEKRANEELANLPGDLEVKKALLKAVDGIEDEEIRKGAFELIKSGNDNMSEAFTTKGVRGEGKDSTIESEYEKLAEQYAKDNDCDMVIARAEVLEKTAEGRELCKKMYADRK
jgi:hypothetical protein